MSQPQFMEVKCCCQPQKLLGWMPIQWPYGQEQITFRLNIKSAYYLPAPSATPWFVPGKFETITMSVKSIWKIHEKPYHALKAEGVAIEQLRRVPGFVEAETVSPDVLHRITNSPMFNQPLRSSAL